MNKADLIAEIAKKSGLTKLQAAKALYAAISSMTLALSKGETVRLIGFGSFAVRRRKARVGRNPKTGAEIKITARKVPVFRASKAIKSSVAKK